MHAQWISRAQRKSAAGLRTLTLLFWSLLPCITTSSYPPLHLQPDASSALTNTHLHTWTHNLPQLNLYAVIIRFFLSKEGFKLHRSVLYYIAIILPRKAWPLSSSMPVLIRGQQYFLSGERNYFCFDATDGVTDDRLFACCRSERAEEWP